MSIKDKFLTIVAKFKELSAPKKLLALVITAIVVVGILVVVGVIPKESIFPAATGGADEFGPDVPSIPISTNEVVNGWFRPPHDCYVTVEGNPSLDRTPASSLEECVEIGKGIDGVIVAGFRNSGHGMDEYKNTCYFHKCIPSNFNKNDKIQREEPVHTMTCINNAEKFEDCA